MGTIYEISSANDKGDQETKGGGRKAGEYKKI